MSVPLQEIYQHYSFKKAWLSDPSTYPLIAVMSGATFLILGMSAHALLCLKDVRISPSRKHETLQTWGQEKVPSVLSYVSEGPSFYRDEFRSTHGGEGLGVDHEAWKKFKEDYNKDL